MPFFHSLIADLKSAIRDDRAATSVALQRGLDATQPLTLVRLGELCALGERMIETGRRRGTALSRLQLALGRERDWRRV